MKETRKQVKNRRKTTLLVFLNLILLLAIVVASFSLFVAWKDRQVADFIQTQQSVLANKGRAKVREGNIGITHVMVSLPLDDTGQVVASIEKEVERQVNQTLGQKKPTGKIQTVVLISMLDSETNFSHVTAKNIEMTYYRLEGLSIKEVKRQTGEAFLLGEDNQPFDLSDMVTDLEKAKEVFATRLQEELQQAGIENQENLLQQFQTEDLSQMDFSYQEGQITLFLPSQKYPLDRISLTTIELYPLINPYYLSEQDRLAYEAHQREEVEKERQQEEARRQEEARQAEAKRIALTFDDGPNANTTPKILDLLKKYNVKATFFVLGQQIAGKEDLLKRMVADGHEIANHSWSHPNLTKLPLAEAKAEIEKTQEAIAAVTGIRPSLVRTPYGAVNQAVLDAIGLPMVAWSVDSRDWESRNPKAIFNEVTGHVQTGSIILLHDIQPSTVEALEPLLQQLQHAGYQSVTASQLLGDSLTQGYVYYSKTNARPAS